MSHQISILSSRVHTGRFTDFVEQMVRSGLDRHSTYTCCVNVHMLIEAYRNGAFREVVNQADWSTPDGKPVAMLMSKLGDQPQERVAGMDLLPALLKEAEAKGARVYFYGDTEEVLIELQKKVHREFPHLAIAGAYSPPFRELSEAEALENLARIEQSGAHLLFVALGCPKQERWMAEQRGHIPATMLGIGNAFRAYLGHEKRAPRWMQKAALEWVYRLVQNPRRLWKRYLITNSLFLWLVSRELITNLFQPSHSNS
ncbi:MAG: WecB/TagA/CpsF family glycosyltransferase [Bacteroidota bacterium]